MNKKLTLLQLHVKGILPNIFLILMLLGLTKMYAQPMYQSIFTPTGSNNFPLANTSTNKTQWLYLPSEIAPTASTGLINKIYLRVGATSGATSFTNLKVSIGTTTQTATTSTFVTGLQQCYLAPTTSYPAHSQGDWLEITLQTPYLWNGTDNLVVEVSQEGYTTTRRSWQYSGNGNRRTYGGVTATTGTANTGQIHLGFDMMSATPCSGNPTAGTASATQRICSSQPFTLSLTGATLAAGITYQWQSAPQGSTTFTNITGANSTSHTVTNQTTASDYRCVVTCTNGNTNVNSNVVPVSQPAAVGNFSEDFDTAQAGTTSNATFPPCWSYIDNITTTGYGYVLNSTTYAQSAAQSFRLYRTNSTANALEDIALISPETVNLGNGTKQLRFSVRSYGVNVNKLEIISLANTTTTANATVLATIYKDDTGYQEYIVPLPATTNDYFGFRLAHNGTTTISSVVIDDVFYEDLAPCMFPMNIQVANITGNTATISWDASLAPGVTGYEYEIRTYGEAGSGSSGLKINNTTTSTSINVTGLDPATQYYVFVKSICNVNGLWTTFPINFYTLCGIVTGNFYESFDTTETGTSTNNNFPHCWSYVDEVASTGYGYVNAANAQSPSNSYRLYRTNTTANQGQNLRLISPETNNLGNGNWVKQIRFSARSTGTAQQILEVFTANGTTSAANFTVLDTILVSGTTYQDYTIYLPQTTDDFFGFNLPHNGTTTAGTVHIDDVYYEDTPLCKPVLAKNISISSILKNGATISWVDMMNTPSTAYEVEVRKTGAPGDPGASFLGTTAPGITSINVTGLSPTTSYYVYVRAICSPTDKSDWAGGDAFSTTCDYPNLLAAPPVVVCGYGPVDLTAIFDGGTVQWFDAKEDGNLVHTGPQFTTPSLSSSTSYWVSAGDTISASSFVGPVDTSIAGGGATASSYQVLFTVHTASLIHSVDIYPNAVGSNGTIDIYTSANVKVFSVPVTTTVSGTATPQKVILDVQLAPGDYYMKTDTTISMFRNTSGASYPYSIPELSITGNSFNAAYYYYFYNWEVGGGGCKSPRIEVPITVTPKPAFELSSSTATSCEGGVSATPVTITTNLGGYDTFVWTPSTGVSGDAVNGWTFSTATEQEYVLSASQSGGICEHLKTVRVFAGKKPEALSTLASTYDLCKNEVQEMKALEALPASVSVGTGLGTTASTSAISAFVQSAVYSKQQYIYSAAELLAQGLTIPGYITDLSFETINSGASLSNPKYTIKMMLTPNTSFGTTNFETGNFVTVFSKENHTHTFQGTQTMVFDSPFYWDGQSNILVEITQEGAGAGNNAETYFTAVTGTNVGMYTTSATDANPATGTRTTSRLNATFGLEQSAVTWSPTANLYLDAATTIPYTTGVNALTVYVVSSLGGTQVYNATLTAPSGCTLEKPITVNVTDVVTPVVQSQTFCQATPVSSVVVTGAPTATYNFYNSATATTPITTISQTGTYYVEAVQGKCKSVRIPFTATVTPLGLPTAQFTQVVCGGGTVSALMASGVTGSQIKWYDSVTSTTPLAGTQPLVDNTIYYASQVLGACESGRVAVLVDINTAPAALTPQTISICGSLTYGSVNLSQIAGADLVWYPSATSQTPIPNTTQIVNGTYYVSQKVNGCESLRVQIIATAQGSVAAPTAGIQNICGSGTVAQLTAQTLPNATAEWYNSATSTTPLASTAVLVNGTYYVSQRVGNCVSVKVPVAVRVISTSAPAVSAISMCAGSTVSDISLPTPSGVSYKWYLNSTSTTPLPGADVLQSGYYFVTRVENGCESLRTQVQITVNSRPSSPSGATPQEFINSAVISNLVMNEPNVVWYATYDDAMKGINPLSPNMPLVKDTTYYAVIIGANGCPSLPTPIEVLIVLGVNDFDLSKLNYYPNPVNDVLTITYADVITNVEVFDLNGRMVVQRTFDNQTVQLDFSSLSAGTYMLNVKTKENSQFIKIVKK